MVASKYVPERGDLVIIDFNPHAGSEQAGKRPALILSPRKYNEKVGLAICCPVTSVIKGYPFEVALPEKAKIKGVILSDHVKSLDWKSRNAFFVEKTTPETLNNVLGKLQILLT